MRDNEDKNLHDSSRNRSEGFVLRILEKEGERRVKRHQEPTCFGETLANTNNIKKETCYWKIILVWAHSVKVLLRDFRGQCLADIRNMSVDRKLSERCNIGSYRSMYDRTIVDVFKINLGSLWSEKEAT